jgi:putative ATPase
MIILWFQAEEAAQRDATLPIPLDIRNAPTRLMKDLGYGTEYAYNPAYAHPVTNNYLPAQIAGSKFLLDAGDTSEKIWDEEKLAKWESEVNGGQPWSGRDKSAL